MREKEAMLENKKKNQKSEPVGVRVTSAAGGDPEVKLLKTQVSQLIEMMALLTAKPNVVPSNDVSEPKKPSSYTVAQAEKPATQKFASTVEEWDIIDGCVQAQ